MPKVALYRAAEFPGFPLGLNVHADSSRLETTELAHAMNVFTGPRGEIQLRTGFVRGDDGSLTQHNSFLFPWRSFDSVDYLIAVDSSGTGASIYHGLNLSFTDSGFNATHGGDLPNFGVGFAGARKKLYVSAKGMADPVSFDGISWVAVPTIPSAKMLYYRHGRMFAINDTLRPSGVYFSEILDPEAFGTDDYIEVNPDDGYEINASAVFGDDLILFKDAAVWKLSGRTPSSFALYEIDSHRGCVSPRAVAQLRSRLFFFDRDTGIWAFDGAAFELVSQSINDYVLKGQNYGIASAASAYGTDDSVFFSIPWGDGSRHTFVYSGETGAWTEYDTGFTGRTAFLDERFIGLPGAEGIYHPDDSSRVVPPSSTPLVGKFRTGWVLIGGAGVKARIRRLEMTIKAELTTDVTLRMYADYDEDTPVVTRTFQGGPAVGVLALESSERRVTLDGWGGRVHAVAFEFETNDWPFQLNDMTVFYTGGQDVRGER